METSLKIGNSSKLIKQGDEMSDELSYIIQSINEIYETFDALKESWTGEKADQYKGILESAREPLKILCEQTQSSNDSLSQVGKILFDYHNK